MSSTTPPDFDYKQTYSESTDVIGTSGIFDVGIEIGMNFYLSKSKIKTKTYKEVTTNFIMVRYYSRSNGENGITVSGGFSMMTYVIPCGFNAKNVTLIE